MKSRLLLNSRGGGHLQNKLLQGFTLSEVLITLGIIGIVAAMTLPSLIGNYRAKQLSTGLKTAYSLIAQAIDKMEADGIDTTPEAFSSVSQSFANKLKNYFEVLYDCGSSFASMNTKYCAINDGSYTNFSRKSPMGFGVLDDGQFVLKNGMLLMFENMRGSSNIYITVDVNGRNRTPNAWGWDVFTFQLVDRSGKGILLPMGAEGTNITDVNRYCNSKTSDGASGIACTAKALSEKDYFRNLFE